MRTDYPAGPCGLNFRRGGAWRKIKKTTVRLHLAPLLELPKDIRSIVVIYFGTAHFNKDIGIVEVGGSRGGQYEDMWFWYRLVKDKPNPNGGYGYRGVLEEPYIQSGWRERFMGKSLNQPSALEHSIPIIQGE